MLDRRDAFGAPAFGSQHFPGKFSRGMLVGGAFSLVGRVTAFGIMQKGGGADNFQVGTFGPGKVLGHPVDTQDMIKIMNGVGIGVPGLSLFNGGHGAIIAEILFLWDGYRRVTISLEQDLNLQTRQWGCDPREAGVADRDVFIISAVRTAIGIGSAGNLQRGKPAGALHSFKPYELASAVMIEAVHRAGIEASRVEDVIWGVVSPIGDQGGNLARLAVLAAGFPVSVPGVQLNRMCGSGQQAIHFGAQAILAGDADIILAGGTEMMSRVPLGADYPGEWPETGHKLVHQGESAELMAEKWGLTRPELDDFALESHLRAGQAIENNYFDDQILPQVLPDGRIFLVDEGVRRHPDRERMAGLKPVFRKNGVITAGNSSQVSDGAAAILLASAEAVGKLNLMPMARIETRVVVGSDPTLMLDGPIPATRLALKKAGLGLDDMDVIEINEAFASVVLAWARELEPDMRKVNPNGGAIAHGHPLGATGAILMTKLVYELERRKARYGLQTMCIGHGMATCTIIERV